jgi:hypothetical protein
VSSDVVKNNAATIERRMGEAVLVQGTRSLNCYIPINSFQLKASPLSGPKSGFKVYDVLPNRNIFDLNTCKKRVKYQSNQMEEGKEGWRKKQKTTSERNKCQLYAIFCKYEDELDLQLADLQHKEKKGIQTIRAIGEFLELMQAKQKTAIEKVLYLKQKQVNLLLSALHPNSSDPPV